MLKGLSSPNLEKPPTELRVMLCDAAKAMLEARVQDFNRLAPDFLFTIGDSEEGLRRMLASSAVAHLAEVPRRGFIRWLLGRA